MFAAILPKLKNKHQKHHLAAGAMHGWARRNGFTWRGKQTVDEILSRLTPPARVEIMLPENYNHALFAVLSPEANVAQTEAANARTEALKIEGDVALVTKVAKIRGLEDLAALIEPLSKLEATVTVLSPPRIVIVLK